MLGIYLDYLDKIDDKTPKSGSEVYITDITKGSGAEDAGLEKGDVVVMIDQQKVKLIEDIINAKKGKKIGDALSIIYLRDGKKKKATVILKGDKAKPWSFKHMEHKGAEMEKKLKKMEAHVKEVERKAKKMEVHARELAEAAHANPNKTFMGIIPVTVTPELAKEKNLSVDKGVYLAEIVEGHGAEAAGLKAGDVMLKISGSNLESNKDLRDIIHGHKPGDEVQVTYYRDGKRQHTHLTFGKSPEKDIKYHYEFPRYEKKQIEEKRAFLGVYLETDSDNRGVRITRVSENSAAEKAALQTGDIISAMDGKPTSDYNALTRLMKTFKPGQKIPITILRNGKTEKIKATLGEKVVKKWVMLDKSKNQAIDVEVIIKEFSDKQEAKNLLDYMSSPNLDLRDFSLYPNPSKGIFNLHFTPVNSDIPTDIKVFSSSGQIVYQERISDVNGLYKTILDLGEQASGMYYLQITQGDKGMGKQLVKN